MSERRAEKSAAVYIPAIVKQLAEMHAAVDGVSTGEWLAKAVMAYSQQQEETHGSLAVRTDRLVTDIVGKFSNPN